MDWIGEHAWQTWLVAAVLLAGAEMATLDLTLLMLAIGALAGCGMAAIGAGVVLQVFVAVAVALAMLGFARPSLAHRLHAGPTLQSGPKQLEGKTGLVLEQVNANDGRIKLGGEVWSARTADESIVAEPGTKVFVSEIDGATAIVYPID
jgi:membrane protein implicated in regulation of membrane protease activity